MCHGTRRWNQVGFRGQSGLRLGIGRKQRVAFDPNRTGPLAGKGSTVWNTPRGGKLNVLGAS
jgi:hypothetical protein